MLRINNDLSEDSTANSNINSERKSSLDLTAENSKTLTSERRVKSMDDILSALIYGSNSEILGREVGGIRKSATEPTNVGWKDRERRGTFARKFFDLPYSLGRLEQQRDKVKVLVSLHCLPDTLLLIRDYMIGRLAILPQNIYMVVKPYRNNAIMEELASLGVKIAIPAPQTRLGKFAENLDSDVRGLLDQLVADIASEGELPQKIICMEDGTIIAPKLRGYINKEKLSADIPVYLVEQTKSGHRKIVNLNLGFPYVSVATSEIKLEQEPWYIACAIYKKLPEEIRNNKNLRLGIIGVFGTIGNALMQKFICEGHQNICGYDAEQQASTSGNVTVFQDVGSLITNSDAIFGCVGKPVIERGDIKRFVQNPMYLINCGSGDYDFLPWMQEMQEMIDAGSLDIAPDKISSLDDISCQVNGHSVTVVYTGLPVNFRGGTSVPAEDFAPVSAGLLLAFIQGLYFDPQAFTKLPSPSFRQVLNHAGQVFIMQQWLADEAQREAFLLGSPKLAQLFEIYDQNSSGGSDTNRSSDDKRIVVEYGHGRNALGFE